MGSGTQKTRGKGEQRSNVWALYLWSDVMLAAISRSTSDAGPFPVSIPGPGVGTRRRGHREVLDERTL